MPRTAGAHHLRFTHAGHERYMLLLLPSSWAPAAKQPLIVMLHGSDSNVPNFRRVTQETADYASREGFIVAYPQGSPATKNGRANHAKNRWSGADTKLLASLVGWAVKTLGASPERVFFTGLGGGGALALHFADAHPKLLRGLAVVGVEDALPPLTPTTSLLLVQPEARRPKTSAWLAQFRARAGCSDEPQTEKLREGRVTVEHWERCSKHTQLLVVSSERLGLSWPTLADADVDSAKTTLRFFESLR